MEPFVLRGFLSECKWPPMEIWTKQYMLDHFARDDGGKPLPVIVRFARKRHKPGEILHDHKSIRHEFRSFSEMLDWMTGEQTKLKKQPPPSSTEIASTSKQAEAMHQNSNFEDREMSTTISPKTHWAYMDYRDILELLNEAQARQQVDWSILGVLQQNRTAKEEEEGDDLDGNDLDDEQWRDSALWIGTPGAYTPCHYDTYGFNLHAQILGAKRWLLFPPGSDLCPTRRPYEESSVFSSLDIIGACGATTTKNGELLIDQRLREQLPRAVVCQAGDLLFVPPRWWHSVQCVAATSSDKEDASEVCVSANKWFPVEADHQESAKEALLKFMMSLHASVGLLDASEHICLTEQRSMALDVGSLEQLAELVDARLTDYVERKEEEVKPTKRAKLEVEEGRRQQQQSHIDFFYNKFCNHPLAERIPSVPWEELKPEGGAYVNDKNGYEEERTKRRSWKESGNLLSIQLKDELVEAMASSEVLNTLLGVILKRRRMKERREEECKIEGQNQIL